MEAAVVLVNESPRHIAAFREGRGFSPAMESGLSLGALAPEAKRLQGLKAQPVALTEAAGLKPRHSKVPPRRTQSANYARILSLGKERVV
jgi:hypothetical protein